MNLKIAMAHQRNPECALDLAPVFAALGRISRLNAVNRFMHSRHEVLFTT